MSLITSVENFLGLGQTVQPGGAVASPSVAPAPAVETVSPPVQVAPESTGSGIGVWGTDPAGQTDYTSQPSLMDSITGYISSAATSVYDSLKADVTSGNVVSGSPTQATANDVPGSVGFGQSILNWMSSWHVLPALQSTFKNTVGTVTSGASTILSSTALPLLAIAGGLLIVFLVWEGKK